MLSSDYKILVLFGTRPEAIKLAPVISELHARKISTVAVSSSQHTDLLAPFLQIFEIVVDYDLHVMTEDQTPNTVCAKVLEELDSILDAEKPDIILVQGDTTTAFAGAFAGFNRGIAVGHVEAGLRSGNLHSPFPEEMNRRLISQMASFHFAATEANCDNLWQEGIAESRIFQTGNTVVDALQFILERSAPGEGVSRIIQATDGFKRILLTTHRRESFGEKMGDNLRVLRAFVETHDDVCLLFPVHPNPNVRGIADEILGGHNRIRLLEPLDYIDFISLMKNSWLVVSDSGGVQEESPSLGKPVLILRENTERPEAVSSGVAKLVGENSLAAMLEENYNDETWIKSVMSIENPFGDGQAATKIVDILDGAYRIAPNSRKVKTVDAR